MLLGLALPHGAAETILELAPFTSCGDTNARKTVQCHHATASGIVDGGNVIHFCCCMVIINEITYVTYVSFGGYGGDPYGFYRT